MTHWVTYRANDNNRSRAAAVTRTHACIHPYTFTHREQEMSQNTHSQCAHSQKLPKTLVPTENNHNNNNIENIQIEHCDTKSGKRMCREAKSDSTSILNYLICFYQHELVLVIYTQRIRRLHIHTISNFDSFTSFIPVHI